MFLQGKTGTTWGANQGAEKSNRRNRLAKTQITVNEIIKSGTMKHYLLCLTWQMKALLLGWRIRNDGDHEFDWEDTLQMYNLGVI